MSLYLQQFLYTADMTRKSSFHRWRNLTGFENLAEIVPGYVN
jgi:hypothetical protein